MSDSNEQMQIEFHNRSKQSLFSLYHAFEHAVLAINRKDNESKFQQLKKQYAITLEQELRSIAQDILFRHPGEKRLSEIDPMFHNFIQDYLHRFIQKANDL